jgi:hypothetical protein
MRDDMLMLKQQTEESGFSGMLNDAYCNLLYCSYVSASRTQERKQEGRL